MMCSLRLNKTCCCCCPLKVGTLVVATVGCVLILMQCIFLSFEEAIPFSSKTLFISRICTGLICLLCYILLIVGVYKKTHKFMLPWLVILFLGKALLTILCILIFVFICLVPREHSTAYTIVSVVLFFICVFNWYCWLIVWSYYMELNDMDKNFSPNVEYHAPGYVQESLADTKDDDTLA